jgi:hypothetical protein
MTARRASLRHRDLAARPGPPPFDGATGAVIARARPFEVGQPVLRTNSRPEGEKLVIGIGEGSPAADRHEPGVADVREDHPGHPSGSRPPGEHLLIDGVVVGEGEVADVRKGPPVRGGDEGRGPGG